VGNQMAKSKVTCITSKTQPAPQSQNTDDFVVIGPKEGVTLLVMPTQMIVDGPLGCSVISPPDGTKFNMETARLDREKLNPHPNPRTLMILS
jgi:hypothetical protein